MKIIFWGSLGRRKQSGEMIVVGVSVAITFYLGEE